MSQRGIQVLALLGLLVLFATSGLSTPARATPTIFTGRYQLVPAAARVEPAPAASPQLVGAIVYMDLPPLALVGRDWSQVERNAYLAQVRAAQDALIPQIEALGGTVRGRFFQLATGLGVDIAASRVADLASLNGVVTARATVDYELALAESVPRVGATAVQSLGFTGRGVDVAVIDSGVDFTHARLGGPGTTAAYAQAYCGRSDIAPSPVDARCTAHTLPPDPALFGPGRKVSGGFDWVGEQWPNGPASQDPNPIDFQGHGTHVADIIAGLPHSDGSVPGVAPGATLWAFKACSSVAGSCEGLALLLALDDALDLDDSDYRGCTDAPLSCVPYDPADVINLSLGSPYGQPEDDLTLFVNLASYYGSLVVAAAGNSGDLPFSTSSPGTAAGALSVAQTSMPGTWLYRLSAGGEARASLLHQPWSATPTLVSGVLTYQGGSDDTRLGCTASGANPYAPGALTDRILLVDRGRCNVSLKVSHAAAAGARSVLIANNVPQLPGDLPPLFAFGGGTPGIPGYTITQADGLALKAALLGQAVTIDPSARISLADRTAGTSARGPRINDNAIKPDIAAPGASVSAVAGSGNGTAAFSGTSGAAPMVAGAAALLIEAYQTRGLPIDADPGLAMLVPLFKAALMNGANPHVRQGTTDMLAPITRIGAGRLDVQAAVNNRTVAWDITELTQLRPGAISDLCTFVPVLDVIRYILYGIPPECAGDQAFGNRIYSAWVSQTGSISFGYAPVVDQLQLRRTLLIVNLGGSPVTYRLRADFRYADDQHRGVSLALRALRRDRPVEHVTLGPRSVTAVDLVVSLDARGLRPWTLNSGTDGNAGTNPACQDDAVNCPTLTLFEYDGYVTIDGGPNHTVRLPWHILPLRAAAPRIDQVHTSAAETRVIFRNASPVTPAEIEAYALVEVSPDACEVTDAGGACLPYVPGIVPGLNRTYIDLHEVGTRSTVVPGLGATVGVPGNDLAVEFALSVYDLPYRAATNAPAMFEVYVDADRDGTEDYVVFNRDLAGQLSDGRNAVFVRDINAADGTKAERSYFFTDAQPNSVRWVLPVPAAAIDVAGDTTFDFRVEARDAYFTGAATDVSPASGYHTLTLNQLRFAPASANVSVAPGATATLAITAVPGGEAASPAQIGMLFFYPNSPSGQETEHVLLP